MQKITDHINSVLQDGILKAYAAGIKSVVEKNKKTILKTGKEPAFNKYDDEFQKKGIEKTIQKKRPSPIFNIDYTAEDLEAIRNFRIEAFTVATIGDYELQEKLKELAINTVREKQSDIEHFTKEARRISDRYIRGDWLKTNLTTATSSSYRAAEWIRLQDPDVKDIYPAYQYKTRQDSHVRDEHRKLADKVFRNHDPILKSIYPPNGWNCRCYVIPLDQDEVGSGRYKIENELRNESETKQLLKDAFPNPKDAKNFMRNPGDSKSIWKKWINEKLSGFEGLVKDEIKQKVKDYARGIKDDIPPVVQSPSVPNQSAIQFPNDVTNFINTDYIPDWFRSKMNGLPTFTFRRGSSHYDPNTDNININRAGFSTEFQKKTVLAHELTHRTHIKNNWITYNYVENEIETSYNKCADNFNQLNQRNKNRFKGDNDRIAGENFERFYQEISTKFSHLDPSDIRKQALCTFDTIAALTKRRYGYGHPKRYFASNNFTYAEYFVHAAENKILGNEVFKKHFPKIYKEMINIINLKFNI